MESVKELLPHKRSTERLTGFKGPDLFDLCDATEAAIAEGGGFGWVSVPPREDMEAYWRGVLLIPERELFVVRLDGTIAGSAQLTRPPRHSEATAPTASLTTFFLAPWARGFGLARMMVEAIEERAQDLGVVILNLDVRETQKRAIQIYEQMGFVRWGTHPFYAFIGGEWKQGHYYYKVLRDAKAHG